MGRLYPSFVERSGLEPVVGLACAHPTRPWTLLAYKRVGFFQSLECADENLVHVYDFKDVPFLIWMIIMNGVHGFISSLSRHILVGPSVLSSKLPAPAQIEYPDIFELRHPFEVRLEGRQ